MEETYEEKMKRIADEFKKNNRERQKKYYDANKEKMVAKAKKRWADTKAILREHKKKQTLEEKTYAPDTDEEVVVKPTRPKKKLVFMKMDMKHLLEQIITPTMAESSKKIYTESAKRLLKVLEINDEDNLVPILNNTVGVIKKIEESDYAHNVKKMLFQFILYALDHSQIKKTKTIHKQYKLKFGVYSEDSKTQSKEKVKKEPLISFSDYLKKVTERFGEDSKMDIIARLYHEFSPRDDFILKIVGSLQDASDDSKNYLVTGGKNYVIILNRFKTDSKYTDVKHTVSNELRKGIDNYMKNNDIEEGDYLFGDKKLTKYVSENNKRIGVDGGINTLRHMSVAELLSMEDLTTEQRVKKAESMMHSVATQELYNREKKE